MKGCEKTIWKFFWQEGRVANFESMEFCVDFSSLRGLTAKRRDMGWGLEKRFILYINSENNTFFIGSWSMYLILNIILDIQRVICFENSAYGYGIWLKGTVTILYFFTRFSSILASQIKDLIFDLNIMWTI